MKFTRSDTHTWGQSKPSNTTENCTSIASCYTENLQSKARTQVQSHYSKIRIQKNESRLKVPQIKQC